VFVELEPVDHHVPVRLVRAEHDQAAGPWFRWAVVGPGRLEQVARDSGWNVADHFVVDTRHFAELIRR